MKSLKFINDQGNQMHAFSIEILLILIRKSFVFSEIFVHALNAFIFNWVRKRKYDRECHPHLFLWVCACVFSWKSSVFCHFICFVCVRWVSPTSVAVYLFEIPQAPSTYYIIRYPVLHLCIWAMSNAVVSI